MSNWKVLHDEESLSDHKFITMNVAVADYPNINTYCPTDYKALEKELQSTHVYLLPHNSVENTLQNARIITAWLSGIMKDHTVVRPLQSRSHWWTPELEALCSRIRLLHHKAHCRCTPSITKRIKLLQRELRLGIRGAKKDAWWLFINIEKPWGKPYKILVKNVVKQRIQVPAEDLLRAHLGPNGSLESAAVTTGSQSVLELLAGHPDVADPCNLEVNQDMVKECRWKTCNCTTPGPDGINYKLLKIINKNYPLFLSELYEKCIHFSVFPSEWKIGKVIWILKEG